MLSLAVLLRGEETCPALSVSERRWTAVWLTMQTMTMEKVTRWKKMVALAHMIR